MGDHEPIQSSIRRHQKLVYLLTPSVRKKGPFKWMLVTKEHFQKPSFLKRMKRLARKHNARMGQNLMPWTR